MTQSTTLLVEAPADLHFMFLDHPTILKYRRKLAALVIERMIVPKRDRKEIQEEIDVIHRQIRGRQIRLLKASQRVEGTCLVCESHIDAMSMFFDGYHS